MASNAKPRLDQLLVDRGLAESRERAQRLIRAGLVFAGDPIHEQRVDKPGVRIDAATPLRVKGAECPYVSRGGQKLAGALLAFGIAPFAATPPVHALDIGASTGGFTDCLLQHGAAHVWAIDTGRAQLHERLHRDSRVTSREQANARRLTPEWVDGTPIDVIVIDVSFISLRLILPGLPALLAPGGAVVALVKPQFEAGPADVGRGGVVREPAVHRRVLRELADWCAAAGWHLRAICASPLRGPAGNCEFFFYLQWPQNAAPALTATALAGAELDIAIEHALQAAYNLPRDHTPAPMQSADDAPDATAPPSPHPPPGT